MIISQIFLLFSFIDIVGNLSKPICIAILILCLVVVLIFWITEQ